MMTEDSTKVWPSGLTYPQAEELHKYMVEGTKAFAVVAVIAHVLAFAFSPWLHFG